jgi:hypothetical protein
MNLRETHNSHAGSIGQWLQTHHFIKDPDPDVHYRDADPQHRLKELFYTSAA